VGGAAQFCTVSRDPAPKHARAPAVLPCCAPDSAQPLRQAALLRTLVATGLEPPPKFLTVLVDESSRPPTVASSLHMHSTSSGLGCSTCSHKRGGRSAAGEH